MIPHPDSQDIAVKCAIITVSDSRTPETDKSGQIIKQLLLDAKHKIWFYSIVKDEPKKIQDLLTYCDEQSELSAIIFNVGT